jgi:DNA-binding beta-propeller fold protein YncE
LRRRLWLLALALILTSVAISNAQEAAYEVWVGNQTTDAVLVFDGRTLALLATIPVDTDNTPATSAPHLITFTLDGRYAFVANVRAAANRNNVVVIDAQARRVVATLPAGPQTHQIIASPDGSRAWVINVAANDLAELSIQGATFTVGKRVPSGGIRPITLVFTRDGKKVYLTHGGSAAGLGSIVVLDATSGAVLKRWDDLGLEPVFTGLSVDGRRIYASQGFSTANPAAKNNIFYVFDPASDALVYQRQLAARDLHALGEAPGRNEVWLTARQANQVVVIETTSGQYQVIATITVPDKPDGMAFAPDGSRVFVAHRGQAITGDPFALSGTQSGFSVINTETRRVLGHIPLDGDIHGLAVRRR